MPPQTTLRPLRTLLASLYETEIKAQRIIIDAGLDPAYIALGSSAINNWQSILTEAHKHTKVRNIVEAAAEEFTGRAQELWTAYSAYTGEQPGAEKKKNAS